MKFNIGDTVRCCDSLGSSTLKRNDLYVVSGYFCGKVTLKGLDGLSFREWRFELCIGNDYNRQLQNTGE